MAQVIIYEQENGQVAVCVPTGEIHISAVKEKDTPSHSIVVEDSSLPQGDDAKFFDAWELSGSTVSVNITKAKAIRLAQYNAAALQVAQKRQLNTLAGISNEVSDTDFTNSLTAGRSAINSATTTSQLVAVTDPA